MVVLEDNDLLHLADGAYGIYSCCNVPSGAVEVVRALSVLDMEVEAIMKVRVLGWTRIYEVHQASVSRLGRPAAP